MTSVMPRIALSTRALIVPACLLSILMIPGSASADDKPIVEPKREVPADTPMSTRVATMLELERLNHTLRQELQKPVDMDYQDTPLKDVIDHIAATHKITIWIDDVALSEVGIDLTDLSVTYRQRAASLDHSLRQLLKQLELSFDIRHGVVIVTTMEFQDEASHLSTRVFPVFDLLAHHRRVGRTARRSFGMGSGMFSSASMEIGKPSANPPLTLRQFGPPNPNTGGLGSGKGAGLGLGTAGVFINSAIIESGDWLIECIERHAGGQWVNTDGAGGNLVLSGGVLVVYQNDEILQRVSRLVSGLRLFIDGKQRPAEYDVDGAMAVAANNRVRQNLQKKIDVDFKDVPLIEVLKFLEQRLSVAIRIDNTSLEEEGISSEEPITLRLKGSAGQLILRLALKPLNLAFYISHGSLVVTSQTQNTEQLSTVMYDLTDLQEANIELDGFGDILLEVTPGPWEDTSGEGGRLSQPFPNVLVVSQHENVLPAISALLHKMRSTIKSAAAGKKRVTDPNRITTSFYPTPSDTIATQLVESLPVFVEPGSWNTYGNVVAIRAIGSTVVVRQRQNVQEKIAQFIKDMQFESASQSRKPRINVSGRPQIKQSQVKQPMPARPSTE